MSQDLNSEILQASEKIKQLIKEVQKIIIWQEKLIKIIIIGLLSKWHILLEWPPWLAKTLTVDTISKAVSLDFGRIQFTPDLTTHDLVWSEFYNVKTGDFSIYLWPIFNNFILADEINRAPAKVQAALLEAMAEKQVTIWKETFKLKDPFVLIATQNSIDQSGTNPLPEAQIDRFSLKTILTYQSKENEIEMYKKHSNKEKIKIEKILDLTELIKIQSLLKNIFVHDQIYTYIANIVDASRHPLDYWLSLDKFLKYWISPRWWISLLDCSKVVALMNWRNHVLPEDIKYIAIEALSHRLWITQLCISSWWNSDKIIQSILNKIIVK